MYKAKVENKNKSFLFIVYMLASGFFFKSSAQVEPVSKLYNLYAILYIQNILFFLIMI